MTGIPSLNRSAMSRASLKRRGSDLWIDPAVAARFDLDETVVRPQLGSVSVRWIYVHMIEETARHAGHADILREQTDGSTGVD